MPAVILAATVASHLRLFHLPWVRRLQASGVTVIGVASDVEGCAECRNTFDGVARVPFSRSPFRLRQALLSGRRLCSLRRSSGARIVHFHTPNAAFWGRLALRREVARDSCKVAYTAHGFHFHRNGSSAGNSLFRSAERFAARYTHALLTINSDDAREANRFRLAAGGFCEFVPGAGIDLDRFAPARYSSTAARRKLCESLGIPSEASLVLMVAEFIPRKHHCDAIAALTEAPDDHWHLLLAGDGPEEKRLRNQAETSGLAHRVHFLGFRSDIPELLSAADMVILPSGQEGLPVCVLEAMAMEKPVIVANIRGSRDLVEPDCGWLHEIGDSLGLAARIKEVISHPEEAAKRARRGQARVVSQYSWPVVQEKLVGVYRRLGLPV